MLESVGTILLIEDDPTYRAFFSAVIRSTGRNDIRIVWAEELQVGIKLLAESNPDVIVSDLNLHDSSGPETIARLQEHSPTAPIVVLSGMEEEELAIQALQYGAQDYLCKSTVTGDLLRRSLRYAMERKRADDSLRCQRDFAERLIESADAIILIVDKTGSILRMNAFAAERTGFSVAAAMGRKWQATLIPATDRAAMDQFLRTVLDSTSTQFCNSESVASNGAPIQVRWAGRSILDSGGNIDFVLITGHDITELLEAQQRALQAERLAAIGKTMIGLAHESRNALQRSQACLSLLERVTQRTPQALDYLARLQRAQDDLRRIHDDLRDYARPLRLERECGSLKEAAEDAWSDLSDARTNRDVHLDLEDNGCNVDCSIDRFRIEQVFRNLFENALSVCADPVRITVSWHDEVHDGTPAIQTSVHDNGPGFTAEQAERAFEVFYTSRSDGTGLGLPIASRIVEAHGGKMQSACSSPNGATILFTLPREE